MIIISCVQSNEFGKYCKYWDSVVHMQTAVNIVCIIGSRYCLMFHGDTVIPGTNGKARRRKKNRGSNN